MDAKISEQKENGMDPVENLAAELQALAPCEAARTLPDAVEPCSHEVIAPARQSLPLVFSSPHSGDDYPADFVAASRLSAHELRRSEDSFVDKLFEAAPEEGAPLLRAHFPRAYVDPNREPFELDQGMFSDRLPDYANTRSPRVAAGLGTIAKIVASGAEIYDGKLTFSEVSARIRQHYWPYHTTLRQLVEATRKRFGFCVLIDCHSMPSSNAVTNDQAAPEERGATNGHGFRLGKGIGDNGWRARRGDRPGLKPVAGCDMDMVLGDSHGQSCTGSLTDAAEASLTAMGYRVGRNDPYSGGFVTRHYGRPKDGVHALQIEISRALYMDEARITPRPDLRRLQADLRHLIRDLATAAQRHLPP